MQAVRSDSDGAFALATRRLLSAQSGDRDHKRADGTKYAELRTLEREGHNSIVRYLPAIMNTLMANGQLAQMGYT